MTHSQWIFAAAAIAFLGVDSSGALLADVTSEISLTCGVQPKPIKSCTGCQISTVGGKLQLTVIPHSQVMWQPATANFTIQFAGHGPCQSPVFKPDNLPCNITGSPGTYRYTANVVNCKVPLAGSLLVGKAPAANKSKPTAEHP